MQSSNQELYDRICNMILSGEMKPGERLSETKLAQELGVSRTPVREVLRILDREGLIRLYPKRFLKVAEYTTEDLQELGMMRIALETLSVRLALFYGSRADLLELRQTADRIVEAQRAGDAELHSQNDAAFHVGLAKLSRNSFLIRYMEDLTLLIRFIIMTQEYPEEVPSEEKLYEHHAVIDALLDGDEEKAVRILQHHLIDFYHLDGKYPEELFR